ncbi:DUF2642 domain-containing protein [Paenisporosarcina sp. NPDC076898]|uniref:DUF2642 domain-containing protein n=1 Tax=unclassified Paenisporosarcina TaxID=2642018 RepID=UPI003CFD79AA
MNSLRSYIGQIIEVEVSSKKTIVGKLLELGSDLIVLFNGRQYVYLPVVHLLSVNKGESTDTEYMNAETAPFEGKQLSLKQILTNASGIFVELFLTGNHHVHGYIQNVQEDYIVFNSPAFKTMYIPVAHLKWLIPYLNQTPYQIKTGQQIHSSGESFAQTFEEQMKKSLGKIVLFDLGKDSEKIGILNGVENILVELVKGNGKTIYLNMAHLKSMHEGK